jgi:hypothetical protein
MRISGHSHIYLPSSWLIEGQSTSIAQIPYCEISLIFTILLVG